MARNLMDILTDAHKAMELNTQKALTGPPREAYTTREPPEKGEKVLVEATYAGRLPEKPEVYFVRYGHEGLPSMVAVELVHRFPTREPEEFEREAPACTEDREDTEEIR